MTRTSATAPSSNEQQKDIEPNAFSGHLTENNWFDTNFVRYFLAHGDLLKHLIESFAEGSVALYCGEITREALIHPELLKACLEHKDNLMMCILDYTKLKNVTFNQEALAILDTIVNCRIPKDSQISDDKLKEHKKVPTGN
jgi:hypothetical protein